MVMLRAGATEVLTGAGLAAAVPGLIAMTGTAPAGLEADTDVGVSGGEEAVATDVTIDMPRGRGAVGGPEDVGCEGVSDVAGNAAILRSGHKSGSRPKAALQAGFPRWVISESYQIREGFSDQELWLSDKRQCLGLPVARRRLSSHGICMLSLCQLVTLVDN